MELKYMKAYEDYRRYLELRNISGYPESYDAHMLLASLYFCALFEREYIDAKVAESTLEQLDHVLSIAFSNQAVINPSALDAIKMLRARCDTHDKVDGG
jgi:hypothetical protein